VVVDGCQLGCDLPSKQTSLSARCWFKLTWVAGQLGTHPLFKHHCQHHASNNISPQPSRYPEANHVIPPALCVQVSSLDGELGITRDELAEKDAHLELLRWVLDAVAEGRSVRHSAWVTLRQRQP